MANSGSLGELNLTIGADPKLLDAVLSKSTKDAVTSAKKIESAVKTNIDRAFKNAQRTFQSTFAELQAGGRIGEAAVLRNAKAAAMWRMEVEKARGAFVHATEAEKQQAAELAEQLKKLREEASKPVAVSNKYTTAIGPALQKPAAVSDKYKEAIGPTVPLTELEQAAKRVDSAIDDVKEKLKETGGAGASDIKKLLAAQISYRRELEATYGSIEQATPKAQDNYRKIERAIERVKAEAIELSEEFNDQRETLNKYGAEWNGLFKAIEQKLGKRGVSLGKAGLVMAAATEGLSIGKQIGTAIGVDYSGWDHFTAAVQRAARPTVTRIGQVTAVIWEMNFALATFNRQRMQEAARGFSLNGRDLLAPLANTQAFRINREWYDAHENPRLPALTRLQYQRDVARQNRDRTAAMAAVNPALHLNAWREAEQAYYDAATAIDAFTDANSQRITQLRVEFAQMTNNKSAINELSIITDQLTARELLRAGVSDEEVQGILRQTRANRELTFAIRDLNEETESKSLRLANAQFDSEFDEQRRLTDQIGQRSLRIAELTGKSEEYVRALERQIAQQKVQIAINEIQRAQETIDLQTQVAQGRGLIDVQKKLSAASSENAIKIGEKQNRTQKYIDALRELQVIEQARLTQERIQQSITISSSELQLAQMRDELSLTERTGRAVEELTTRLAKLQIERMEASPDWSERMTGILMRQMEQERPKLQALHFATSLAAIDREIVAHHASVQQTLREQERVASIERIRQYEAEQRQGVITFDQKMSLIARSRELLDEKLRDIDASYGQDWERWAERLAIKYEDEAARIGDAAERVADASKAALSDGLFNVITEGVGSAKEAFKDLGRAILREITNIVASKAVASLARLFMSLNWSSGGGAAAASAFTSTFGYGFANGGIASGGFIPFGAFASGGTVTRPTLGLVGEGRYDEAIVPLPDGKSIPVTMNSGARAPQPVIVNVSWHPSFVKGIIAAGAQEGAAAAAEMVIPIVTDSIANNRELRHVIRASV